MNWDRVEGNWKAAKGALEAAWGKLADNDIDIINGERGAPGRQAAARTGYIGIHASR